MGCKVIPSGSLGLNETSVPVWAKPTVWWGIQVGCLARVLPLGGLEWSGEIVVVLGEEPSNGGRVGPRYRVSGRKGITVLPYYTLSVEGYPSRGLDP